MPRVLGKALAIGGAALAALATFLPAYSFGDESATYWTFNSRWDVVTIILLVAVVTLGIVSIVRPMRGVNIALAVSAGASAGVFLPYAVEANDGAQAALFLMAAGGVIACVGGVFVLLTEFVAVPVAARASAPTISAPTAAHIPAGWFPDPAGGASQRYWDGRAWTEHVHAVAPG